MRCRIVWQDHRPGRDQPCRAKRWQLQHLERWNRRVAAKIVIIEGKSRRGLRNGIYILIDTFPRETAAVRTMAVGSWWDSPTSGWLLSRTSTKWQISLSRAQPNTVEVAQELRRRRVHLCGFAWNRYCVPATRTRLVLGNNHASLIYFDVSRVVVDCRRQQIEAGRRSTKTGYLDDCTDEGGHTPDGRLHRIFSLRSARHGSNGEMASRRQ